MNVTVQGLPAEGRELNGKVALITGGAKNIGRAISLALASAGASVAVNTLHSREDAEHLVKDIRERAGAAELYMADIADGTAVREMADAVIKRFGRIDILVLNASIRREALFKDMTFEEWRNTMSITSGGCFFKNLNALDSRGALVFLFAFVSGASLHFAAQIGKFNENSKQPRQLAKRFSELCVGANARENVDSRDGWRETEADECAIAGRR